MKAHLVGSLPVAGPEAAFRAVADALGPYLPRLPDGETGRRADWVGFVRRHLGRHPAFEKDERAPPFRFTQWDGRVVMEWPLLRFRDGIDRDAVVLETGYADDAIGSYAVFVRLQDEGAVPPTARYQVCLATPHAIALMYIAPADRSDFVTLYTRHLAGEIARIAAAIPPTRLAVQWDVCQEMLWWDGYFPPAPGMHDEILRSLIGLAAAVPEPADLGYHLCYGSPLDAPCLIPHDMGTLVAVANGVGGGAGRRVDYIHLPVTQGRRDAAFFAPLAALRLPSATELYLGCVRTDDADGNLARLYQAAARVPIAGIGAECGLGRGEPAQLAPMLAAHRDLIEEGNVEKLPQPPGGRR